MHLHRLLPHQLAAVIIVASLTAAHTGCSQRSRAARALQQAHRHYDAGDFEKAEIEYKNVLQKDPQNVEALRRLGMLYHEEGRDARAAAYLLKARELQPENLDVRLPLGLAQLAIGGLAEARDEALFILQRRPADSSAPLLLVEASPTPVELEKARGHIMQLDTSGVRSPARLVALGNIALRQNRAPEATALFQEALALDPKFVAAHSSLAVLHWSAKNVDAAEAAFKRAAELSPVRSPKRLHYAQFKRQAGDTAAGTRLAADIVRQAPGYVPAWVWLADVALADKKLDEADAHLAKALARESLQPEALLLSARLRIARGQPEKAVQELERMLGLFPRSAAVAYQLSLAYAAAGDTAKAIGRLSQVTAAAPDMLEASVTLAELHLRKRDFSAAIAVLKPLLQKTPEALGARLLLAEAHRGQGNFAEAASLYTELRRSLPQDPQVAFAGGLVLLQQGRLPEARNEFVRTRELKPDHIGALEQLVELDLRDRQPAAARQRLDAALAAQPASPHLTFLLAKVCTATADSAGVEAALQRTIELQPNHTAAHYQLARLYVESHRQVAAIANLQATLARNPQSLGPLLLLAVLLDEQRDFAGARDAYEKALALEPKSTLALNNLAYLYAERFAQPDRALDCAQRAHALQPQEPRIADTLGWAHVKKRNYTAALPLLQESASRLPREPEVQYHLGVAHYMLGDEPAAAAALQRVLELDAGIPDAADARQRLALLQIDAARATADHRALVGQRLSQQPDDPVAQLRQADLTRLAGDGAAALKLYKSLLQTNPRSAAALIQVAQIHSANRETAPALEAAKAARNAAPGNPAISHRVGRIALDAGDHRWAASLLQEAAKLRPEDADVLFDWAAGAYSVGRVSEAEATLRRALELAPDSPRAKTGRRDLEMIALAADRTRAATSRTAIERTLQLDASCAPARFALGLALEADADQAPARQAYETLLARLPEFAPAQRNLAILYARAGIESPKAAALAQKARQLFARDPELTCAAGIIAYRQGEFSKAVNFLQEAAAQSAADSQVLYYLGMAQCRLNKAVEGRKSLQRALELGLVESLAAEARKRLASAE